MLDSIHTVIIGAISKTINALIVTYSTLGFYQYVNRMRNYLVAILIYRQSIKFSFSHFASYLLYCVVIVPIQIIGYISLSDNSDNLLMIFFDWVFYCGTLYAYSAWLISLMVGLKDWRTGIPIEINFAKKISRCFNKVSQLLVFAIPTSRILFYVLEIDITYFYVPLIYAYIARFFTVNIRNFESEIRKLSPEFEFNSNYIWIVYLFMVSFCAINVLDTRVDNRFYQIILTTFLVPAVFWVNSILSQNIKSFWMRFEDLRYHNNYLLFLGLSRASLAGAFLGLIALIWNANTVIASYSQPILAIMNLITILFGGEIAILAIGQSIKQLKLHYTGDFSDENRKQRISTLFSVIRPIINTLRILLCVVMILTYVGASFNTIFTNITGVFIALSFLIKEECANIISGITFVFEDSINIGHLVEINKSIVGTVEEIGIRTLKIRSIDGNLNIITHSQVKVIVNKSSGHSFILLNIAMPPHTKIPLIEETLKNAMDIAKPKIRAEGILVGGIEFRGAVEINSDKIIYQARIKCSPGKQFTAKRILNTEIYELLTKKNLLLPKSQIVCLDRCSVSNSEYKMQ